ncbi:MAG: hypothetical protein VW147_07545 [Bacteroidota bacterium]
MHKFLVMGVTRLERKGRKNKTVAKVRVATIKRLRSKSTVESPNKEESGVVIGGVMDVLTTMNAKPAKSKKAAPKKEVVEETETTEEVQ